MTTFPGFSNIYSVDDPFNNRWLRADVGGSIDSLRITRGEIPAPSGVRAVWAMGGARPSDFVWTTSVHPIIMHTRIADLLMEKGLSGWSGYAVEVVDKTGRSHSDYFGLCVHGRAGAVDLNRSVVVLKQYPAGWFPHFLGHYFDPETWDGSDFIMHEPDVRGCASGHVMVSERVAAELRRTRAKNVGFTRLTEVSVSTSIYEIGRDYLLPDGFARAVDSAYSRAGVPKPV